MPMPRKRNKMVRHEMQFPPDMLAWLRLEARRKDTSIADVVRKAVMLLKEKSS